MYFIQYDFLHTIWLGSYTVTCMASYSVTGFIQYHWTHTVMWPHTVWLASYNITGLTQSCGLIQYGWILTVWQGSHNITGLIQYHWVNTVLYWAHTCRITAYTVLPIYRCVFLPFSIIRDFVTEVYCALLCYQFQKTSLRKEHFLTLHRVAK